MNIIRVSKILNSRMSYSDLAALLIMLCMAGQVLISLMQRSSLRVLNPLKTYLISSESSIVHISNMSAIDTITMKKSNTLYFSRK